LCPLQLPLETSRCFLGIGIDEPHGCISDLEKASRRF
jgi:hypothetical protein